MPPQVSVFSLETGSACAAVRPDGAHVTAWEAGGEDLLFVSREAVHVPGVALRGGVPVIFPQFADSGPYARHGFARKARWTAVSANDTEVVLDLRDSPATRADWPHAFRCTLRVALTPNALAITLAVENTGEAPFDFTAALHTYLRVADVHAVTLGGLDGTRYQDKVAGGTHRQGGPLGFDGLIDRVYEDAPDALTLSGSGALRALRIEKDGFADVVVWNPWREGADALGDMAADEYRQMLCVEAAQVAAPITLAPGATWAGTQRLVA